MKKWYLSKTLWLNILGGVVLLTQYLSQFKVIDPKIIEGILIIGNFFLRFKTDTRLKV